MPLTDLRRCRFRLKASLLHLLDTWRLKPAVQALMAFRGFQLVASMITVSELGAALEIFSTEPAQIVNP